MYREELVRFSVNSRVMINADFFWKMNPNYSRPRIDLTGTRPPRNSLSVVYVSGPLPPPLGSREQVKSDGLELDDLMEGDFLVFCLTVLGFSFSDKL
jgi:hypothetical protein